MTCRLIAIITVAVALSGCWSMANTYGEVRQKIDARTEQKQEAK